MNSYPIFYLIGLTVVWFSALALLVFCGIPLLALACRWWRELFNEFREGSREDEL